MAEVTRLADGQPQLPAGARAAFLERLASVELQLGEPALARKHLLELAELQPEDLRVPLRLLELAIQSADRKLAFDLVARIRAIEGEDGTLWRFGQACCLLEKARRGAGTELEAARGIARALASARPEWWGSALLLAEIAELEGRTEDAIHGYTRAVELGSTRAVLVRRLVGMLGEKKDFDEIDRVIRLASSQGSVTADLTIAAALAAMRQKDYDRGIALARRVFSERSSQFADHLYLGQFYVAAGRPIEAGAELRRAVELGPRVPVVWVTLVSYLVAQKQLDQAKAAIEAAHGVLTAPRADLALAQCYALVGDGERSDAMLRRAVESPSCDVTTIRVAADLYVNQGRFDRVEAILDKVSAASMNASAEIRAWANRTRSLVRLSTGQTAKMDEALAFLDENLRANPTSADDLRQKAIILALRTSKRGDAIKLLESLDQSGRLGVNEQFVLAQIYLLERLDAKYRRQMTRILEAPLKNPGHLSHFVDFLIDHRELDQADHWLAELKRIAPRSSSVLEREARLLAAHNRRPELLALLLDREHRFPEEIKLVAHELETYGFAREAEAAYKAFIAGNPDDPERVLSMAVFLAGQDRSGEAAAILDAASKNCRPESVAWTALALYSASSADDALRRRVESWVAEAIQKNPAAASFLRPKLATIYSNRGRHQEAEALFREILVSDPDHVETLNNLAWELALREGGDPREALSLIDRAIEKAGTTSTLVDTRCVALIRTGDAGRASHELREALASDPRNVSLALHLAWACQASGNDEQARDAFQQARALGLRSDTLDPFEREIVERLQTQFGTPRISPLNRG